VRGPFKEVGRRKEGKSDLGGVLLIDGQEVKEGDGGI